MTPVQVQLHDLERGHLELYLEPGESIDLPADRVRVDVLEEPEERTPWGVVD